MYITAILAVALPLFLVGVWKSRKNRGALVLTTYDEICALLDPPGTSISSLLRARAIPNARLLHAFGIHNSTFASSSHDVHRTFKKHVLTRLRAMDTPLRWQRLKGVVHGAIDFYIPDGTTPGQYSTCIQAIVFTTVLAALFDCIPPFPDAGEVRFVTEGINNLWISSKSTSSHPSTIPPTLSRINHYLQVWLPRDPSDPFIDNPLEIILVAYETLWRLCAHAYIHVEGSPKYTAPFLDFFDSPTSTKFRFPENAETPSAHDLIQEVLRLHPPTKRIKRTADVGSSWVHHILTAVAFCPTSSTGNIVAADIEALQRSSVWDPLSHEFHPMRHQASTEAQRQSFMPFGLGPLSCVASTWAPRFAGMIIAGLAMRDDVELVRGESPGERDGWEGWRIRRKKRPHVETA